VCRSAPACHQRAVQALPGRGHIFERTGIIEHERRERMRSPLRVRHHEFSKSLSALGMFEMVSRIASSIDVVPPSKIGDTEFATCAVE